MSPLRTAIAPISEAELIELEHDLDQMEITQGVDVNIVHINRAMERVADKIDLVEKRIDELNDALDSMNDELRELRSTLPYIASAENIQVMRRLVEMARERGAR
jgi:prefoldin subunit 5